MPEVYSDFHKLINVQETGENKCEVLGGCLVGHCSFAELLPSLNCISYLDTPNSFILFNESFCSLFSVIGFLFSP